MADRSRWHTHVCHAVRNGHVKRITDQDIQSSVLEIMSDNVASTYVVTPADPQKTLGIKLPFLVMIIKNLKKYFSFEVQVLDDKNVRRRFRASNYQVGCTPPWLAALPPLALAPNAWYSLMRTRSHSGICGATWLSFQPNAVVCLCAFE